MQPRLGAGIRTLRPGRNADASKPNAANYDEALANPYPLLPDPVVTKGGATITTADAWWNVRRPEIVEDFEREVVGRVPREVPAIAWSVVATREWEVAGRRVVGRQPVGTVDNSAYPAQDLGRSDDYRVEKMPPVNAGLLDGALAWRQHDGGHTDGPNWRYFIPWAGERLGVTSAKP